jgi:hypothetical protein
MRMRWLIMTAFVRNLQAASKYQNCHVLTQANMRMPLLGLPRKQLTFS